MKKEFGMFTGFMTQDILIVHAIGLKEEAVFKQTDIKIKAESFTVFITVSSQRARSAQQESADEEYLPVL